MDKLVYGRWSVIDTQGKKWLCRCECGTERRVLRADLISGRSTGCECKRRRTMPAAQRIAATKHGMEKTVEYRTWVDMRRRCSDARRPDFHRYGGRGIFVCQEWEASFEAFFADMGNRPDGHTLDRIDNNGPYSKNNCRWATRKEQSTNTRLNFRITAFGVEMTASEAAELYGLQAQTIIQRLKRGWDAERALTTPPDERRRKK